MNLHLLPDDKFLDPFIEDWETVDDPLNNTYLCYSLNDEGRFNHIRSQRVIPAPIGSAVLESHLRRATEYDKIFLHWLHLDLAKEVQQIPNGPRVLWCFWGGDLYQPGRLFGRWLHDQRTRQALRRCHSPRTWDPGTHGGLGPLRVLRQFYLETLGRRALVRAVQRCDYLLHWNVADFDIVRRACGGRIRRVPFAYPLRAALSPGQENQSPNPLTEMLDGRFVIQLGNSDNPSNNHLSVLHQFASMKLPKDAAILCPLNYGPDSSYADIVCKEGGDLLGERFVPLRTFLERDVYLRLLEHVDSAVMNHRRTQAAANVLTLLSLGKRVFLNRQSTLYSMLTENLDTVGAVDEMNPHLIQKELSRDEIIRQEKFVKGNFGRDAVMRMYERIRSL